MNSRRQISSYGREDKPMRKIALFLAIALLLTLPGCGSETGLLEGRDGL